MPSGNLLTPSIAGIVAIVMGLGGCQDTTAISSADSVFINGKFYAGDVSHQWPTSVAIDEMKFVYVGDDASAFVGPDTKVVDLRGQLVIPGLIDAHSHPGMVALSYEQVVLDDASTKDELMEAVRKMVAEHPDEEVLMGGYLLNELFDTTGPRKEDLDSIEPDRPVILFDDWAHSVWANSAALLQAGVTAEIEDIVPGFSFYQKDESGEPTGWITESATSVFVNNFQAVTPRVEAELLAYLNYYRSIGVTTVLDAGNFGLDREVYTAVSRLDKKGLLPVRYHGVYTLFLPDDLPNAVASLKKLGDDFNSEKVRIDTLKVFLDGVIETRTAAMSYDYLDTPGNSGATLLSRKQLHDLILELESEGLNLHVHAVGDRATTTLLDAVQDAHDSLSRAPTIRIALTHLEMVDDLDMARFKQLGVIANLTPHWNYARDLSWYRQGIGEAATKMQRSQSLVNAGAVVTFSSDVYVYYEWTSDRANPFLGMQVGHNRQDVGTDAGSEFLPPLSERLQLDALVDGYTLNAAYQLGRSDEFGSIDVGKRADLLVLDQDIFEIDRYEIYKTKPVAVIVDGELVSGDL